MEQNAYEVFKDGATAIGPSLVYGGKRFSSLGDFWTKFVKGPGKIYVMGNDALRNISPAPLEDWVEKMIFSPPVKVEAVAKAIVAVLLLGTKMSLDNESTSDSDNESGSRKKNNPGPPRAKFF